MAIYKEKIQKQYCIIPMEYLKSKDLTLKERGLLSTLYGLPENWNFSVEGLAHTMPDGVSTIGATLISLVNKGYIKKNRTRGPDGRFSINNLQLYIHPDGEAVPSDDKPQTDNPHMENPYMENPYLENPNAEDPNVEYPSSEKLSLDNPAVENHGEYNNNVSINKESNNKKLRNSESNNKNLRYRESNNKEFMRTASPAEDHKHRSPFGTGRTKFHNFNEREYDFQELEKELYQAGLPKMEEQKNHSEYQTTDDPSVAQKGGDINEETNTDGRVAGCPPG